MKPCVVKTSVDGPSANASVDNPSASQGVCSGEWLLNFISTWHVENCQMQRWQAVGMVRGGMSYRQAGKRINVSHSVIVRLKQRVKQIRSVKEPRAKLDFCKGTGELIKTCFFVL
jgi:hypothetical protein